MIPGVAYNPDPNDFWMRICRDAWKFHREHPEGPHAYGAWDAIPGRSDTRPTHLRWLRQYPPLVEEGTRAWLEVTDSDLFKAPPPQGVVVSLFANREVHLVLANYGNAAVEVATSAKYVSLSDPEGTPRDLWSLKARGLEILRLRDAQA